MEEIEIEDPHPILWGKMFLPGHFPAPSSSFHWIVADMIFGSEERAAMAAPRGHAKSTLAGLACMIFGVATKKFKYALLISDTASQAEMFIGDIKNECETNDTLLASYPGLAPGGVWTKNDLCFANGCRIQAVGAGMKLRGRKHRGSRPDFVLVDDLENDEAVATLERRIKLRRWFLAALLPALAPGGRIRVIGTILHSDSLLSRLLRNQNWTRRLWRAISENGTALWPQWKSLEVLMAEKEDARQNGLLSVWYQEYQNQAIAEEEAPFRTEDITYFSSLPADGEGKTVPVFKTLYVDPAISLKEKADFSAYVVVYSTHDGFWWIMDAFRKKHDPAQLIDTVKRLNRKHGLDVIGIESVQYQKSISFWLEHRAEEDDEYLPIEEVTPDTDKRRRILALQPYFRNHRIKIREGIGPRLEEELLNIDAIDHDDLADALAGNIFINIRPEPPAVRKRKFKDAASDHAYRHRKELARMTRLKKYGLE